MKNTKWYNKTIWVILSLIFFLPLGIYALAKNTSWSKNARVYTGGLFLAPPILIVLLAIVASISPSNSASLANLAPTNAQEVEASPPDLETQITEVVTDELGRSNWDSKPPRLKKVSLEQVGDIYTVLIDYRANDNLSRSWIQNRMISDAMSIVQRLSQEARFDSISSYQFTPYFLFTDRYGNTSEGTAGQIEISRDVARRINWDNMYTDMFKQLLMREGTLNLK